MSIAIEPEVVVPNVELIETDGEPLETPWHRMAINLLIEVIAYLLRGRTDYFVGGNMFLYYSEAQARNRDYRGPDFFFVKEVDGNRPRDYWAVWEEDGRYPDAIIELLSKTTAETDRTMKKRIYQRIFKTPDYYCYDPDTELLEGWRLDTQFRYQPLTPNDKGWLWCEELELFLGTWRGKFQERDATWLRFYDREGYLLPIRAVAAEAELATLKAQVKVSSNGNQ